MKYAVIRIGGSQFKVAEGDRLSVDKIEGEIGKKITLGDILLLVDGEKLTMGKPFVKGAEVKAEVVAQIKGKKIRSATYHAKSRHRRVVGFRALKTSLLIKEITVK